LLGATSGFGFSTMDSTLFKLAYEFEGKRYDCGAKLGFLIATVEQGLLHQELKDDFKDYLKELATRLD
jgi:UTP--glucose-1-phosphate uridylyltransferase